MIPALPEVEAYRDRILAGMVPADRIVPGTWWERAAAADRRRVERDVEGLRESKTYKAEIDKWVVQQGHALRYWTDLTEVGALHGVPWEVQP